MTKMTPAQTLALLTAVANATVRPLDYDESCTFGNASADALIAHGDTDLAILICDIIGNTVQTDEGCEPVILIGAGSVEVSYWNAEHMPSGFVLSIDAL